MSSYLCTILTCLGLNYITWSAVHLGGRLDLGGHWGRQDVVEGVAGRGGGVPGQLGERHYTSPGDYPIRFIVQS